MVKEDLIKVIKDRKAHTNTKAQALIILYKIILQEMARDN